MASFRDSGVPPSAFSQESTQEPDLSIIYIDYMKFEEQEMRIIGTF